jgi:hypothetical protein
MTYLLAHDLAPEVGSSAKVSQLLLPEGVGFRGQFMKLGTFRRDPHTRNEGQGFGENRK